VPVCAGWPRARPRAAEPVGCAGSCCPGAALADGPGDGLEHGALSPRHGAAAPARCWCPDLLPAPSTGAAEGGAGGGGCPRKGGCCGVAGLFAPAGPCPFRQSSGPSCWGGSQGAWCPPRCCQPCWRGCWPPHAAQVPPVPKSPLTGRRGVTGALGCSWPWPPSARSLPRPRSGRYREQLRFAPRQPPARGSPGGGRTCGQSWGWAGGSDAGSAVAAGMRAAPSAAASAMPLTTSARRSSTPAPRSTPCPPPPPPRAGTRP